MPKANLVEHTSFKYKNNRLKTKIKDIYSDSHQLPFIAMHHFKLASNLVQWHPPVGNKLASGFVVGT